MKSDSRGTNIAIVSICWSGALNEAAAVPLTRTDAPTNEFASTLVEIGANARKRYPPDASSTTNSVFCLCDCADLTTPDTSTRSPSTVPDMNCSAEMGLASGNGAVPNRVQLGNSMSGAYPPGCQMPLTLTKSPIAGGGLVALTNTPPVES